MNKQYKRLGLDPNQQLFVQAFDGDALATRKRILVMYKDEYTGEMIENISEDEARSWVRCDWFTEALQQRAEREARLTAELRRMDRWAAVCDRVELQALWSAIARGEQTPQIDPDTKQPMLDSKGKPLFHPIPSMRDRLAAAKMLADSLGMNVQTVVHEGGEKPIQVQKVDLEERVKLFRRLEVPTEAWLQ